MPNYDAILIGTGQSGPALARRLVAVGRKVAIVERKRFGGTCVNNGCTPIGLDKAGIATDKRGYIQVDEQLRTNVPGIWAMGDCNGRGAFTHTSWNDFEIVAANLLDDDRRSVRDRITAYALYTDPPLGRAGMTEAEVRGTEKPALIATRAMENVSRAYEKGETKGFMKILVDRESKQI